MNMRSVVGFAVTVTLATLCLFTAPAERALADTHAAAGLLAADSAWANSLHAEGRAGFFETLHPNVRFFAPHMPMCDGYDQTKATLEAIMAMPGFNLHWFPAGAEVSAGGDLGWTYGTHTMQLTGPDGAMMEDHGKYVTCWKKDASGVWKVVADIFNTNDPAPTADDDDEDDDDEDDD